MIGCDGVIGPLSETITTYYGVIGLGGSTRMDKNGHVSIQKHAIHYDMGGDGPNPA